MKFLRHMSENLFITFTGIAALVHSTWSLGTMFSGIFPTSDEWGALAYWLLPAFFVAFAMDVGQISTSADIRHKGLTLKRGIAFFAFAVGTYYLQFVYIAHHMPLLTLGNGVSAYHRPAVEMMVNAGIWILPLLLPLSTMLYTIADGDSKEQPIAPTLPEPTILVEKQEQPLIEEKVTEIASSVMVGEYIEVPMYPAFCVKCGWVGKSYEDEKAAKRAIRTHHNLHCSERQELEKVIASNGHVD